MMENEFEVDVRFNSDYVLIELKGKVSDDFLLQVSKYLQESSEYKSGMSEIWDITHVDLSDVNPEVLFRASDELYILWEGYQKSKVAVVSGKSINMGHIHLFRELYQRDDVNGFETLIEAEKWLAE